jgi:hypothetical protein
VLGGHGRTAATTALHAAERRSPRPAAASVTIMSIGGDKKRTVASRKRMPIELFPAIT